MKKQGRKLKNYIFLDAQLHQCSCFW